MKSYSGGLRVAAPHSGAAALSANGRRIVLQERDDVAGCLGSRRVSHRRLSWLHAKERTAEAVLSTDTGNETLAGQMRMVLPQLPQRITPCWVTFTPTKV